MKCKTVVAAYMRLSQDDGDSQAESNSIVNQRHLLRSYIAEHFKDYELLEFQDDGYSGTNFNRPGISELLNKVRNGKVDCIVVKDLSRFSRDYIEAGVCLEQIFPFAGVRFIAVNDGYDSGNDEENAAGMGTAFKSLMNDFYCKDISVKVKSALRVKKEKGIYANGNCAFGYCKDPKDRHKLLVVEEEAAIVRRIFQMTLDGASSHEIARQFNAEGVKTPAVYKMERGIRGVVPKGPRFEWEGATICRMLGNAIYAGDMVYDKYETPEVSGRARLKPQSQWKVFKNHHEAIIDRKVFEQVRRSRGSKSAVKHERHPLTGKVECGCCHKSLRIAHTKNPYFFCGSRYVTQYEGCIARINVQFLEQYLLFRLQEEADKGHVCAVALYGKEQKADACERRKQTDEELKELRAATVRIYEAYALKTKSREDYIKEKQNLQERIKRYAERHEEPDRHVFTELTKEIADRFVKRVVVFDERNIETEWNFPEKLPEELD